MNDAEPQATDLVPESPSSSGDSVAVAADSSTQLPRSVAEADGVPAKSLDADNYPGESGTGALGFAGPIPGEVDAAESRDFVRLWQGVSERLNELTQTVERQLSALTPVCQRMLIDDDERREQAKLRELMHERLEAARPMFQLQILRPVIQRLASMFDLLSDLQRSGSQESAAGFAMLADHLRETLSQQSVDIVLPQIGDRFDRNLHFVITTVPTDDPECHERISQVVLAGFVHVGAHDKSGEVRPVVLRPARVVTWKYTARESPVSLSR